MVRPAARREAVAHLKALRELSERRACKIEWLDRKMVCYRASAGFAPHLTTAIVRITAPDGSSARQAIAQPAPIGVNDHQASGVGG